MAAAVAAIAVPAVWASVGTRAVDNNLIPTHTVADKSKGGGRVQVHVPTIVTALGQAKCRRVAVEVKHWTAEGDNDLRSHFKTLAADSRTKKDAQS